MSTYPTNEFGRVEIIQTVGDISLRSAKDDDAEKGDISDRLNTLGRHSQTDPPLLPEGFPKAEFSDGFIHIHTRIGFPACRCLAI